MNRRERRAAGIKERPAVYTLTQEQLDAVRAEGFEDGRRATLANATEGYLSVSCLSLRDKFGFGQERLASFIDGCMFILADIGAREMEFSDCVKTLRDETGIDMVGNGHDIVVRNLPVHRMEKTVKWGVARDVTPGDDEEDRDWLAWMKQEGASR